MRTGRPRITPNREIYPLGDDNGDGEEGDETQYRSSNCSFALLLIGQIQGIQSYPVSHPPRPSEVLKLDLLRRHWEKS